MPVSFITKLLGRSLRVGDRVRLAGGYDVEPQWLGGRSACFGECVTFMRWKETRLAAVVRLDEPLTFDSVSGAYVVLRLRHVGARWANQETVHLELFAHAPDTPPALTTRSVWIESHANYRVEASNNLSKLTTLRGVAYFWR